MSNNNPPSMPISDLERRLEELKDVPVRSPLQASSARARFLHTAAEIRQAVSSEAQVRQSGWTFPIRKEKRSMNALVSLILAASLLLGGGATVAAAQDDLPTQPLYQLKLWTENATLAVNGNPQERANLLMTMAQTRVQEMAVLAEMEITPPAQLRERLEQHLNQVLKLAASMDEATRDQYLLQLRDQLQSQDRILERLQARTDSGIDPTLVQTRQMLQIQLRLVDEGLNDPQGFRYIIENQLQFGQDESGTPEPNRQGDPVFHQYDQSGKPFEEPGTGNGSQNGSGESNSSPGNQIPNQLQNGNGDSNSHNDSPGDPNPDNPQGGQNGQGADSPGGGGGR